MTKARHRTPAAGDRSGSCHFHQARRRSLLRAYPELGKLLGQEPSTAGWIALVVCIQCGIAALIAGQPWWVILALAYTVGAIAALAMWTLLHECTHDLVFASSSGNRWLGLLVSLPLVLPVAAPFRRFHLMHHRHMGDAELDGDIASRWECRLVGNHAVRKALWLVAGPLVQALRPMRMQGIRLFDRQAAGNLAVQLAFDAAIVWLLGWGALCYLLLSNLFALGLHPLGARWIQEHYTMRQGQETYSYYGPFNLLVFNAGLHVEHHDLPRVSWNRLPALRRIAPEHYRDLYAHTSWSVLLLRFILDSSLSLESRTIRKSGQRL